MNEILLISVKLIAVNGTENAKSSALYKNATSIVALSCSKTSKPSHRRQTISLVYFSLTMTQSKILQQ